MPETERKYPWTFAELDAMPTLAKGQSEELKIDTGNMRVWIEPSYADYPGVHAISIEWLVDGQWVQGDRYTA